ncbi:unnamed protein product, partial [Prorocentrum cordatum]
PYCAHAGLSCARMAAAPPHPPAAAPVQTASVGALTAHYEQENQALREQAWHLRQWLEHKEQQVAQYTQLLAASCHEGDFIAGRIAAVLQAQAQADARVAPS